MEKLLNRYSRLRIDNDGFVYVIPEDKVMEFDELHDRLPKVDCPETYIKNMKLFNEYFDKFDKYIVDEQTEIKKLKVIIDK